VKLKDLYNLRAVTANGNPCADELGDAIKKELIMLLP